MILREGIIFLTNLVYYLLMSQLSWLVFNGFQEDAK